LRRNHPAPPAVSRARVATPAAQSLKQKGGCAPGSVRLDPVLAVSVPRPRKSDRRSTPPRVGLTALATPRKDARTRRCCTPVTAGIIAYSDPNAPPGADHARTQASKDTGGCGEFESRRSSYISPRPPGARGHTVGDHTRRSRGARPSRASHSLARTSACSLPTRPPTAACPP